MVGVTELLLTIYAVLLVFITPSQPIRLRKH